MVFRAGDRVGAVVFDDVQVRRSRSHRSRARVQEMLGAIAAMKRGARRGPRGAAGTPRSSTGPSRTRSVAVHATSSASSSDFAGAGERTLELLRALRAHNDVIGVLVFDPLANTPVATSGRVVVSGGELQAELDMGRGAVREPLAKLFAGRLRNVVDLLRRSGVPLLAVETEHDTTQTGPTTSRKREATTVSLAAVGPVSLA
jgi:uncharacterized protein (DUF58 family)